MVAGAKDRGPGLQAERTTLAWQRTVLALVLGAFVLGLGQLQFGQPILAILAAVLAVAAAVSGVFRSHARAPARPDDRRSTWYLLTRTAGLVVALAALGLASSVWKLLT